MLSKKAKQLLSKESKTKRNLKFQLGGPTVNIDPTFNPLAGMDNSGYGFDNNNYQMNPNQPIQPDLNTAQNYNYTQLQDNTQIPNSIQQPQTPTQPQGNWQDWTGALGKIGFGIKSLVEGQKERKNAKIYERISKEENDRRLENQRETGYVLTPYTNKRTWSMKKGGMYIPMPSPFYQEGGLSFNNNLDQFLDTYNNQMEQQQLQNQMFQDHFDNNNLQKKMKWKGMQKQGIQSLNQSYKDIQGAIKQAFLQQGGTITDISQIDPNWKSKTDAQLQFAHDSIKEQGNIARQEFKIAANDNSSNKVKSKVKIDRLKQDGGEINKYNTSLTDNEKQLYNKWKSGLPKRLQGTQDYDLQGFWKENPNFTLDAEDAHLTDKFKKPNHETFSLESQYATGKNTAYAGAWDGDNYVKPMIKYGQPLFVKYQEGGEIDTPTQDTQDAPDTESLYSPDFVSPVEHSDFEPQESLKSGLESWIFQDEAPIPDTNLAQQYSQSFNPVYSSSGDVIESIKKHESGGNPEVQNMIGATGYYQFTPQWASKISAFMGLPSNTPKDQVMKAFAKNPQAQDAFMKHVVENIYKPKIEELRPFANKYGFNDNEMIKLLHYRGLNDAEKRLKTGNFEVSQEEKQKYNNPDILTYIKSK